MNVLNLSEGFELEEFKAGRVIEFEKFVFSGGEPHIKLQVNPSDLINDPRVVVTARVNSSDEMLTLVMAVDALKRAAMGKALEISLFLPYFPGARQDRPMVVGEPLSAKIYADIINSMNLHQVGIYDPHSDVSPALLNNCLSGDNHTFVKEAIMDIVSNERASGDFVIISPDAGANKKSLDLVKSLNEELRPNQHGNPDLIKCDKTRDVTTGKITNFEVYADDLKGANCIIVDDICDGGGTFLGLAEELKKKNAGKLFLVVSHGIFSKGFVELNKKFEHIYCTNSLPTEDDPYWSMKNDNKYHRLTVLPIKLS